MLDHEHVTLYFKSYNKYISGSAIKCIQCQTRSNDSEYCLATLPPPTTCEVCLERGEETDSGCVKVKTYKSCLISKKLDLNGE